MARYEAWAVPTPVLMARSSHKAALPLLIHKCPSRGQCATCLRASFSLSARTVHTRYFEGSWKKMWRFFYPSRAPRSTYRVIWGNQEKIAPSSGGLQHRLGRTALQERVALILPTSHVLARSPCGQLNPAASSLPQRNLKSENLRPRWELT